MSKKLEITPEVFYPRTFARMEQHNEEIRAVGKIDSLAAMEVMMTRVTSYLSDLAALAAEFETRLYMLSAMAPKKGTRRCRKKN